MGTKNEPGAYDCYAKADDNEPIFTLRAHDPFAWLVVQEWANHYANSPEHDHAKFAEAMACSKAMRFWYRDHVATDA